MDIILHSYGCILETNLRLKYAMAWTKPPYSPLLVQPENPAQLEGKIYEMMGMALSGKWSAPQSQPLEAEIVEPVEAGSQKWVLVRLKF